MPSTRNTSSTGAPTRRDSMPANTLSTPKAAPMRIISWASAIWARPSASRSGPMGIQVVMFVWDPTSIVTARRLLATTVLFRWCGCPLLLHLLLPRSGEQAKVHYFGRKHAVLARPLLARQFVRNFQSVAVRITEVDAERQPVVGDVVELHALLLQAVVGVLQVVQALHHEREMVQPNLPLRLQRRIVPHLHQCHLVRLVLVRRHERGATRTEVVGVQAQHVLIPLARTLRVAHVEVDVAEMLRTVTHRISSMSSRFRKSRTRSIASFLGYIAARARARVNGSEAKKRSYNTCRLPNELPATSQARRNRLTRSRAETVSVARYCSIWPASGPLKSASLGVIMKLDDPSSCRISIIRG